MNSATVLDMSAASVTIRSSSAPSSVTAKPAGFAVIAVSRSTSLKTSTIFFSAMGELHPGGDLRDDVGVLLGVEQSEVPGLRLLLHELDAVTLARARDDHYRLLTDGLRKLVEGLLQRRRVVPVDLADRPAEGLEALAKRLDVHRLRRRPGSGEAVGVHDRDQVAELVVAGGHRGLPDLALLEFPVAGQHERPVVAAGEPGRDRHASADRQVVPEGARREVDAARHLHVRVVVQRRADLAELLEPVLGVEAQVREHRPQPGGHVALAEEEPVPVRPVRLARAQAQGVVVEGRDELRGGERGRVMAEAGLRDQVGRLQPYPVRPAEQLGVGERAPALQGDVIWHDASLNSAQLVDNMALWYQAA